MKFSTRSTAQGYEAKWWLEDDQGTIIHFELPENTIYAWQLAVKRLLPCLPQDSLTNNDSFCRCEFIYDFHDKKKYKEASLERMSFCKFILALGREISSPPYEFCVLEVLEKNTHLFAFIRHSPYHFLFLNAYSDEILFERDRDEGEWEFLLEEAYKSNTSIELLVNLISHYDVLREFSYLAHKYKPQLALVITKNYAALVKAILRFLDIIQQDTDVRPKTDASIVVRRLSQKYSPCFYALLVENESLNLDERQEFLDLIFSYPMSYEERALLLQNVLADLVKDAQETPENIAAMQTVTSLISQYYLNRYALDKAVSIWEQTFKLEQNGKDRLLRAILLLYKHPGGFVIPLVAFTVFSFVPVVAPISMLASGSLVVVFLISLLIGLWTIANRFLKNQGFSYLELFLPRLFGSIVVGLSLLALESTVWEITLDMTWWNWSLMAFAAFIGSIGYLFLDIHKNTRLLPDELNLDIQEDDQQKSRKAPHNAIERSVQTTFRIYSIGLLEAFGLTTMVSALIPLNALGDTFQALLADGKTLLDWHGNIIKVLSNNAFVFQLFGSNGLTLTYFPKLIVLWAGLSLLIGAFVQLLWQDRQITSS